MVLNSSASDNEQTRLIRGRSLLCTQVNRKKVELNDVSSDLVFNKKKTERKLRQHEIKYRE